MKVTFIESPEGLMVSSKEWEHLKKIISAEKSDVLIMNEMPFGQWLAASNCFDENLATNSISDNANSLEALNGLEIPLVLSSRPLAYNKKLVNEAFALENGDYLFAHQKHYFPNEEGFYEPVWFEPEIKGFTILKTKTLSVGILLCTELMFNEWARFYGKQGAQLIAVPRATGQSYEHWKTAASMAAIASGCYVVSSNRVGRCDESLIFGGKGFAYAPDGSFIAETSIENPVVSFEMDLDKVKKQKLLYPCNVKELATA